MNEMIKEFKKGDLLHIDKDGKAQWGFPKGYPYKEQSRIEFLLLNQVEFVAQDDDDVSASYSGEVQELLVEGEKYAVVIDDKTYEATAFRVYGTATAMGNKNLGTQGVWDDEDVPFVVATMKSGSFVFSVSLPVSEAGIHTVEIYKLSETIHPIAPEFLSSATTTTSGIVKQMSYLPNATGDVPTAQEFNALLKSLRDAGILATS